MLTAFLNPPTPTDRVDCPRTDEDGSSLDGIRPEGAPMRLLFVNSVVVWLLDGCEAVLSVIAPVAAVAAVVVAALCSAPVMVITCGPLDASQL
jgi:hypothetical protein